jgi:hypothetical protein
MALLFYRPDHLLNVGHRIGALVGGGIQFLEVVVKVNNSFLRSRGAMNRYYRLWSGLFGRSCDVANKKKHGVSFKEASTIFGRSRFNHILMTRIIQLRKISDNW